MLTFRAFEGGISMVWEVVSFEDRARFGLNPQLMKLPWDHYGFVLRGWL